MKEIANQFNLKGTLLSVEPYGNGHINCTYLAKTTDIPKKNSEELNTTPFLLQKSLYKSSSIMVISSPIGKLNLTITSSSR